MIDGGDYYEVPPAEQLLADDLDACEDKLAAAKADNARLRQQVDELREAAHRVVKYRAKAKIDDDGSLYQTIEWLAAALKSTEPEED